MSENGEDQRETRKHNTGVRNDLIRKTHRELLKLEAEKAEIQEQIREKRKTLKDDIGITLKYFDIARHMLGLEDEEKGKAQDDLKEAYGALSSGETLDWVVATSQEDADQPPA